MESLIPNVSLVDRTKNYLKEQAVSSGVNRSVYIPKEVPQNESNEVAIIKGLSAEEYLRNIWFQLNGYEYDYLYKVWEKYTDPIMNKEGIRNLMLILRIVTRVDFSNVQEADIPKMTFKFFKDNLSHFFVYHEDFGLDLKNINIVETAILNVMWISLRNAKNAGHRNVVRGTLSESVFLRALGKNDDGSNAEGQKKGFFGSLRNAFRRKR